MIEANLPSEKLWDLCIVGTGPVGLALALEWEQLGHSVLMLESGGPQPDPKLQQASRAHLVNLNRHAEMEIAVCRALGGTSWTWGGRAVAYDGIDWLKRSFVPGSEWPFDANEIAPFYSSACRTLACGDAYFSLPFDKKLAHGMTIEPIERWSRDAQIIHIHGKHLIDSPNIHICLNSTVTGLEFSTDNSLVHSLAVKCGSDQAGFNLGSIRASNVVLAMGGVETTRLLLHAQRYAPDAFGGTGGPLGRYYMGHISGKIASIVFNDPRFIDEMDFKLDATGSYIRRRFMLSTETQLRHQLLNAAFWPDNPAFYDPSHKSGVLSSVFLAIAFPPTGRLLLSEAIRLAHTGPRPYQWGAHIRNAILGAPQGALDIFRILRDRFIRKPKKPGFLVKNNSGRYALHYHAEQIPQADSRITLAQDVDAFGQPRVSIDLRFADQDIQSVIDSHARLDEALQANGIGHLEYYYTAAELPEKIDAQAADGIHQAGTTRMGSDPATSVVDENLKIHGVTNLYIASSSVFPGSGQANCTLLAAAFAVRLAHHLNTIKSSSTLKPSEVTQ